MFKTFCKNDKNKFLKDCLQIIFTIFLMNAICPEKAFAYLDPGTGSMVLQAILAAIVGVGCTFKIWKQKLFDFIKKVRNGK